MKKIFTLGILMILFLASPALADINFAEFEFTAGTYLDHDGDGRDDDVIVFGVIEVEIYDKPPFEYINFDITLILPSGRAFTYDYRDKFFTGTYHFVGIFLNHALESGDYTAIAVLYSDAGKFLDQDRIKFDPPRI